MQRRKFLIGTGSIAAGGAAVIGSGAFNIARADRTINVDTVDDSNAYLRLESTSAYTTETQGTLEISFQNNGEGEGLSDNANYVFTDLFKIENQGTNEIAVTLSEYLDEITWDTTYPRAYYSFDAIGTENDVNGDGDFTGAAGDGAYLTPGDQLYVHFEFVGRDAELDEDGRGTDTDVPETVGVYAEARS